MLDTSESKILAIDTSTDVCSVAISNQGDIKESTILAAREHTQRILPMVESILGDSNLILSDLDAIAVANGPGSFTGLRIGLSIAQGLSYGADLPLIPISTLKAMANAVLRERCVVQEQVIIPALDARMNEIYWSAYRQNSNSGLVSVIDESVNTPNLCYEYSKTLKPDNTVAVGSGWHYYSEYPAAGESKGRIQADITFHSTAYDIVELAANTFANGSAINPMNVSPTYLRNEISWQKRQRIRS